MLVERNSNFSLYLLPQTSLSLRQSTNPCPGYRCTIKYSRKYPLVPKKYSRRERIPTIGLQKCADELKSVLTRLQTSFNKGFLSNLWKEYHWFQKRSHKPPEPRTTGQYQCTQSWARVSMINSNTSKFLEINNSFMKVSMVFVLKDPPLTEDPPMTDIELLIG